jgi:hypothetical protein
MERAERHDCQAEIRRRSTLGSGHGQRLHSCDGCGASPTEQEDLRAKLFASHLPDLLIFPLLGADLTWRKWSGGRVSLAAHFPLS